jgi:hypothetical protein
LLPNGGWQSGITGEEPPVIGAVWRGYFDCAERILRMYGEKWAGREKITRQLQQEGWAYRDRNGTPAPLEVADIRRVTNNWPEYGGIVLGKRARDRHPFEYDPEKITLNPERAVFDVELLKKVGRVQKERTVRPPDRGHAHTNHPYPLSALTYCAHCEQMALAQNNPKLRSRLGGKSQSCYRHKAGAACGCRKKSVTREVYERDFLRLIKLLMVKPDKLELMTQLAYEATSLSPENDEDIGAKKAVAIAKCRRKIDAARHLYEDGELSREEYLRRKEHNEREIGHWESYTTEAQQLAVELALCVDMVEKIVRLWEISSDEDKQGMARNLFTSIIYDLDQQRIVDFQLKPWADRFLILRGALYPDPDDSNNGQEANQNDQSGSSVTSNKAIGTKGIPSLVRVIPRSSLSLS